MSPPVLGSEIHKTFDGTKNMEQVRQKRAGRHVGMPGIFARLVIAGSILICAACNSGGRPPASTPSPSPLPPDTTPPTSVITSPAPGATVPTGARVDITGTASDAGGGSVARVELSVDGGATYQTAAGTTSWSYAWTPVSSGPATIRSRAVDDSGNQQNPVTQVGITVTQPPLPDTTPPTSVITSPAPGATVFAGARVDITGTASDSGGGSVARVDVSVDGGATYQTAVGTTSWSYAWTPTSPGGPATIRSRAIDNSGNLQDPVTEIDVVVVVDTLQPQALTFAPAGGADDIPVGQSIVVTFSEALDPSTVNVTTIELRDPSNTLVPATVSYSPATFAATLVPTAPLSHSVTYLIRARGGQTDPRIKDAAGNALASNATSTFRTEAQLQVDAVTPAASALDVPTGIAGTARFSRSLDPTSVNSSTVVLSDMGGNPIPVTVSYAADAFTIALVPQAPLQPDQVYTVTLEGGPVAPHITDPRGQPLAADFVWSFTTAPPIPTFSLWTPADVPGTPITSDSRRIELGLKFRSQTDGFVTAVRFYKGGPANGGTHEGTLWSLVGAPLGSAVFTDETASGWQQARFPAPVVINANTVYVVSYLATQGNYSSDIGYFLSSGVDSGPLHALSSPEAGNDPAGNGVFLVGGGFPGISSASTNYWVDLVFSDSPAVLSPRVLETTPAPGASGVSVGVAPTATFSQALDPTSVNSTTVLLRDMANNVVPASVAYDPGSFTITITPSQPLQPARAYTLILEDDSVAPHITDSGGRPLAADFAWSFTTSP